MRIKKTAISRAYRRSSLKTVLMWACICLILSAICLYVSVKFWLGPAYVAMRAEETLGEFWLGPVRIGEINFGYDGVMFVSDISFCDQAGAVVMKASGVKFVPTRWPSLTASPKTINIEHVDLRLELENGKLNLPVQTRLSQEAAQPNLEHIGIKSITFRAASGNSETVFERLAADVTRAKGFYKLSIGNNEVNDSYQMKIDGVFDLVKGNAGMRLKFAQKTTPEEMKMFLSAAGVPAKWSGYGKVDADLRVQGRFSDIESLWPKGMVKLNNWTILTNQQIIGSDMDGMLNVAKRHLNLKILKGAVCGGGLKGSFHLDIQKSGPIRYGADVRLKGIDMAELTKLAETSRKLTKGTGSLNLQLYGDVNAHDDIRAYGSAVIDNADLWQFPVMGELFKIIGKWEYKIGGLSDANVVFRLWGPRMTIERGHLSNSFSAIEAERGGKINLKSGQIDMYVVGIPLKDAEEIIRKIPVANWFMNLKDKLIRLQLKGNWSDPADKLIHKQSIKDIKAATLGFFVDIAKSGGDITSDLKNAIGYGRDINEPEGMQGQQ